MMASDERTETARARFLRSLFRQEIVLSYGCTEPAAVALAAAAAAKAAGGEIRAVKLVVDIGTFKNALSVGLPGTGHRGPDFAAAAGTVVAAPERRLSILADLGPTAWERAAELVRHQLVEVIPAPEVRGVRIEATVEGTGGRGTALIEGRHDRLTRWERAGEPLPLPVSEEGEPREEISDDEIRHRLATAQAIVGYLDSLSDDDLALLEEAVEVNRKIAEVSFEHGLGLGVGRAIRRSAHCPASENIQAAASASAKAWAAAAVEARMAGYPAPAMTAAGSGNSGITVTLGTWAAAVELGASKDRWLRAIALAQLVNLAIKARIGRVGPLCGGATASALGVGAAVAWLLAGDAEAVDRTIQLGVNSVSGSLCDGAKPACALRIACGLGATIDAAFLAVSAGVRRCRGGLAGGDAADAFERLHRLALTAYGETDAAVTAILQSPG